MSESQYLSPYLKHAGERYAAGLPPWTPGTFVSRAVRGRRVRYVTRYVRALQRSLGRAARRGDVVSVRSKRGGVAYVRSQPALFQ